MIPVAFETFGPEAQVDEADGDHGFRQSENLTGFLRFMNTGPDGINTGIAGSGGLEVNIGDIVLSTSAQQHDMNAVPFGYEIGVIPQQQCSDFPADPELLELAQACCAEFLPGVKVHTGRVVTGDLFVARKEQKTRLRERFDALCTEMEGAAIAHAAWLNQTPFLVVRAISDNANAEAVEDYPAFEKRAAACSAKLVRSMLRRLA